MNNKIIITILLVFSIAFSYAQTTDTLYQFAKSNEALFWKIVSKNYNFTPAEIGKYKDDINFRYLSENENIEWNAELIKQYETLLSKTYSLQRNKGINWNETLINEFLDSEWFDWSQIYFDKEVTISKELYEKEKDNFITTKFLIKESNDSLTFFYKNDHVKNYDVFEKYLRNWYKESDSIRVRNFNELKPYFGSSIYEIPNSLLMDYKEDFDWHYITQYLDFNWTWELFSLLFLNLEESYIPQNSKLYETLFNDHIDSIFLSDIFYEFSKNNKYFKIDKAEDEFGYIPDVAVIKENGYYYIDLGDQYDFTTSFPDSIKGYSYKIDDSSEGPKRYKDIMFFYRFDAIACTENVKIILEKYDLPSHRFYPIEIILESDWYGNDTASYYMFVINNSSILSSFCPEKTKLKDENEFLGLKINKLNDSLNINDVNQFIKFIDPLYYNKNYRRKYLSEISLKQNYDIVTLDGEDIYISKRLKKELELYEIGGIAYQKEYLTNWILPDRKINIQQQEKKYNFVKSKLNDNQRAIVEFKVAKDRQKNIASQKNIVKDYYRDIDLELLDSTELKLIEIEKRFNIVFPEEYRKIIFSHERSKLGRGFNDYYFLSLDKLEQVDKAWYKHTPQTYRGVLIAEDGSGYNLVLILDENSSFKLSNIIYKFEEGKIIKTIKIN